MQKVRPLGGKILTKPFLVLMAISVLALIVLIRRFLYGLGAVSNMSDGYPWGIWIAYDVVVGTALACGGYAVALSVYVMNNWKYHPLVRPAILTSMFGYTLGGVSILFDVGRYWQAYNPMLPKYAQLNSVLFEVALCIAAYVVVLWIEFAPTYLEGRYELLNRFLKKVLFVFIALGILLPTMHQSSLGTLLVIAGPKLSPLWQTTALPILFLISAIAMGFSAVILESIISALGFKKEMELDLLSGIARYIPPLLGIYLVLRFTDLIMRGGLTSLGADIKGLMFVIENISYVVPLVILSSSKNRLDARKLFISAVFLILAGGLYRFNVYLIGFDPGAGWRYFPSVQELIVTLGIISIEVMAYIVLVKRLPVLQVGQAERA